MIVKTIRQLAQAFGLSRATLLYYDRVGLLRPWHRTSAGHRLYSAEDEERLGRIRELRAAGMSVRAIVDVLEPEARYRTPLGGALEKRLAELNHEIAALRRQQQVVLALLGKSGSSGRSRVLTKEKWVALLEASGMDHEDRNRWHVEFERVSPEAHQDFLESLGIEADEINRIRRASQDGGAGRRNGYPATPAAPTRKAKRSLEPRG